MHQEEPGLVPEPCRDNQRRFLPSECDDNEPQRQNLVELEKSYRIPHANTTTTPAPELPPLSPQSTAEKLSERGEN